jgi:putative FmdB family regulatory protein
VGQQRVKRRQTNRFIGDRDRWFREKYIMPTYDYECDACGHLFELFQGIHDPIKRKCPQCKKLKLRRLFGTGAAILFKGSGFYETDYRSDSYKSDAKKASSAEKKSKSDGGSSKKSSNKSDSKSSSSDSSSGKGNRSKS